ncbi:MAG: hypothetical protein PWP27_1969 [Clostridiales bacterium]|jgi:hypothetical protein|nr:hypothetical protein [Clostridiales bacterium]MDK2934159.1 hypothetical protein [Clostridiales bacterium]
MTIKELEQNYNEMVEMGNYLDASNIAFKIAALLSKEEYGWYGCEKPECQKWIELGYRNAVKVKKINQ